MTSRASTSPARVGLPDLDTRPAELARSTLWLLLAWCVQRAMALGVAAMLFVSLPLIAVLTGCPGGTGPAPRAQSSSASIVR